MKKVLITGHRGFVGKNLVQLLNKSSEVEVCILENKEAIFNIHQSQNKYDHIIHLAALTSLPASWSEPHEYYHTNVLSTSSCLEYCRKHDAHFTLLSTCLYTSPFDHPVDESHPVYPSSPYGFSKLASESLCNYYSENLKTKTTIFRPFNLYGPGQSENFVIPHILKQVVNQNYQEIEIQTLKPKRDFVFISDLVELLFINILNPKQGLFNIGTGTVYSIEEIIQIAQKIYNTDKNIIELGTSRNIDHPQIICNIEKTKSTFQWTSKTNIFDGIKYTLDSFY